MGRYTCPGAVEGGHLECMKWARHNGCPLDKYTCTYAAQNGHLECLRWARENGCPWDEGTCAEVAKNGHLECLECLEWANGCPDRLPLFSARRPREVRSYSKPPQDPKTYKIQYGLHFPSKHPWTLLMSRPRMPLPKRIYFRIMTGIKKASDILKESIALL